MKKNLLKKVLLNVALGGAMLLPNFLATEAEAAKVNIAANTSGGSYRTSITKTGVHQTVKDGDITLGNQINFGTYQQSSNGSGGFNIDPVAWIVVEENTGGTAGRYTLVSTKVLDGDVPWDESFSTNNWGNLNSDASQADYNLRAYLNNIMYDNLFDAAQKALIKDSNITTYKASSGDDGEDGWDNIERTSENELCTSTDKLYLMSVQELHDWFKNDADTNPNFGTAFSKVPWGAGATDYARNKGVDVSDTVTGLDGTDNADYFLRSPSSHSTFYVRYSYYIGAVYSYDATYTTLGVRPALQIDFSSLIFTSASEYSTADARFTKGKGSAATGGDAVKLETIFDGEPSNPGDTLDLTLYDATLGAVTTNTTLELSEDDIKLGYSGSGMYKSVAGMLATGSSSGYTPVAWGRLAEGSASGTGVGVFGLGNADADTEYSLLIFNEQGIGTSFVGDANLIGKVKKVSGRSELDITDSTNIYSGAVTVGEGNKLMANADQLTGTDAITDNGTIIFTGGTLGRMVNGAGNLDFAGDVSTNADNIATTGTNTVESGKTLTFTGGTLTKNITGNGTTEFNNTVSIADGINLGTASNNVNGTLDLAGNITVSNINFASGSTLKVDGNQIMGTAAITGLTSATVASGAKLYVSNAVGDTPYKILAGSGISISGWQTDAEMGDGFRAAYGLMVDTDNITNNGNEFTIQFKKDTSAIGDVDISNLLGNAPSNSALYKFVDNLSLVQPDRATQATIINTMANLNSLANVQQSTYTVSNLAADSIHNNIDVFQRPILGNRDQRLEVRNVAANIKDNAKIETVELGESENIMPSNTDTVMLKYEKEVWANYIHSKRTIDGMKTGKVLQQDSTSQYNGITAGIDLWNSTHGFGGIALTAVDGKTNANQTAGSIKNETDYKGISIYNRYDTKNIAILTDFTYTHSDHDIKMNTKGTDDITAKPKADAYSFGIKIEQPIATGKNSELAPYVGARYTKIHTKDYKTSLDLQYDIDSQNIFNIPIGIAWRNQNQTRNGWKIGEVLETGYVWNLGDRDSSQHLSYGGTNDNIGFAMADKGEYFARAALRASHKDTDFELGYKFTKGDTAKDSQWNFNVNHSFGNSKGLPYKSVLLGKIDLLEAANRELRAENYGLKTENVELNNQVKDLQAENEKLKALLASK